MFSERELDGIDRTEYEFFKRYNGKNPENGGCRKNKDWTSFLSYIIFAKLGNKWQMIN